MAKTIDVNIDVNVDNKSINELEADIAKLDAKFKKAKPGTKEFTELGNKIKQAQTKLKDFDLAFEALDKEQRATALVDTFAGMADAIAGVGAGLALVGVEGETINKIEENMTALLLVTQGFRGGLEALTATTKLFGIQWGNAGKAIKNAFVTAEGGVKGFRVALASIGIGLVIAGLTALIENLDKVEELFFGVADAAELSGDEIKNVATASAGAITEIELLTSAVNDQTKSEEDRQKALDELARKYPAYFGNLTQDINDTKALEKAKSNLVDTIIKEAQIKAASEKIEGIISENLEEQIELEQELNKLDKEKTAAKKALNKQREIEAEKIAQGGNAELYARRRISEAERKLQNIVDERAETEKELSNLRNKQTKDVAKYTKVIDDNKDSIEKNGGSTKDSTTSTKNNTKATTTSTKATKKNTKAIDKNIEALKEQARQVELTGKTTNNAENKFNEIALTNEIKFVNAKLKVNEDGRKTLKERRQQDLEEITTEFQQQSELYGRQAKDAMNSVLMLADGIFATRQNNLEKQLEAGLITQEEFEKKSDALGKQAFERNKQLSIAQATVSTIQGGIDAFMSSLKIDPTGITGTILAGLAVATGVAQIAAIESTNYQSPNIPSTSIGGGGGASLQTPSVPTGNVVATKELFNLQSGRQEEEKTQPLKTYVLAGDVSDALQADNQIKRLRKL